MTLTLASTSSIRRQMLTAAGVDFSSVRPCVDEDDVKLLKADARAVATELAARKATSVAEDGWVIGSDSVVSVSGRLFSKPQNRGEARDHLRFFSGRTMLLTSAVALASRGTIDWALAQSAKLVIRELSTQFIDSYLDAEWPEVGYTVGVFRLEGRGVQLFSSIEGDHFTILGMPLVPLLGALRDRGLLAR